MRWFCLLAPVVLLLAGCGTTGSRPHFDRGVLQLWVGPFGARNTDSQQACVQRCLNRARGRTAIVTFAPGDYVLSNGYGLAVSSGTTLVMEGARFLLGKSMSRDGQAFLLDNATDVTLRGGEIVGQRDAWSQSVNIAGVRVRGASAGIRIEGLTCRDLSGNAVGVFAEEGEKPIRNVELDNVKGVNCCNEYTDYLQPNPGPAPGSDRKDQGSVAFYNVDGWLVDGCRFEDSHSDGTHFFHCRNGRFIGSAVTGSRMGGYFLEGCEHVTATGCLFENNGSRGVTIERDSRFCSLTGCIVSRSGREGLWMPDVEGIVVEGNVFQENGQKDDGHRDAEMRIDDTDEYTTSTGGLQVAGNVFKTGPHQTAAVLLGPGVALSLFDNNTFSGPAPHVLALDAKP